MRLSTGSYPTSPLETLKNRRLVLIVTGGVAAFKAVILLRLLVKNGARVRVAMTEAATRFITPLTFEALSGQPVVTDLWTKSGVEIDHVAWAEWAELLVGAPATADFLARVAQGRASDFASSLFLASQSQKLLVPSMNSGMFLNPATQDNLALLKKRGLLVMDCNTGLLACGQEGPGRMPEPTDIALEVARLLNRGPLSGQKILISAGATREPWDEIRFLSNRSSGQMGLALGLSAWLLGAEVSMIAGPMVKDPEIKTLDFRFQTIESTEDLLKALKKELSWSTALIMNAAPADFKPKERERGKIKKDKGSLLLDLEVNPDILKELSKDKGNKLFVGFAAEDNDLVERARGKLEAKNLDFIVANKAGGIESAFGSPDIRLWLVSRDNILEIGTRPKFAAAWTLWPLLFSNIWPDKKVPAIGGHF